MHMKMTTIPSGKSPRATDVAVGAKIRETRLLRGMSQEKLATACGITFQQIQKYEHGTNRVGASRLIEISKILDVPVSHFFAGTEEGTGSMPAMDAPTRDVVLLMMATTPEVRAAIRDAIKAITSAATTLGDEIRRAA
jgi:transcriptional regulator with XRE-family HTH domain